MSRLLLVARLTYRDRAAHSGGTFARVIGSRAMTEVLEKRRSGDGGAAGSSHTGTAEPSTPEKALPYSSAVGSLMSCGACWMGGAAVFSLNGSVLRPDVRLSRAAGVTI